MDRTHFDISFRLDGKLGRAFRDAHPNGLVSDEAGLARRALVARYLIISKLRYIPAFPLCRARTPPHGIPLWNVWSRGRPVTSMGR